jgi:ADP-ribosyl-[dinitrogen reductase] hydrolase
MLQEKFDACIICGAIGDAWGGTYENEVKIKNPTTYYLDGIKEKKEIWNIADDAQLTLAFCESLNDNNNFSLQVLSKYFVKYYREKVKRIGRGYFN